MERTIEYHGEQGESLLSISYSTLHGNRCMIRINQEAVWMDKKDFAQLVSDMYFLWGT